MDEIVAKIRALPNWQGDFNCEPLSGGLTNLNYLVSDKSGKYVVRLGSDILEHHVMRFNELAASRAAHAAGLSPKVVHSEDGMMVLEYIESKTYDSDIVRMPDNLDNIVSIIRKCHVEIPKYLRGPVLSFSVFHVIRDYVWTLKDGNSVHLDRLSGLSQITDTLEKCQGHSKQVFGHNDLVAANFLDDGSRLWLIDWDYAGFNTPLFDLANLASNNEFGKQLEVKLLETYFDKQLNDDLWRKYSAIKCASLLREAMWSMVSEIHSEIEFDFHQYTLENLTRFENAYKQFSDLDK